MYFVISLVFFLVLEIMPIEFYSKWVVSLFIIFRHKITKIRSDEQEKTNKMHFTTCSGYVDTSSDIVQGEEMKTIAPSCVAGCIRLDFYPRYAQNMSVRSWVR